MGKQGKQNLEISILGVSRASVLLGCQLLHLSRTSLTLNVVDAHTSDEWATQDLVLVAAQFPEHKFVLNSLENLERADFVFYFVGQEPREGVDWCKCAKRQTGLVHELFRQFRFSGEPYVIVASAPSEIICYHIWQVADLNPSKIIGLGTALETMRLRFALSQKLGLSNRDVSTWVLGAQGAGLVPLISQTFIQKQYVRDFVRLSEQFEEDLLDEIASVPDELNQPSYAFCGVAHSVFGIFRSLLGEQVENVPLSVQVGEHPYLNERYQDLFVSLPVHLSRHGVQSVHLSLEEEEAASLEQIARIVESYL